MNHKEMSLKELVELSEKYWDILETENDKYNENEHRIILDAIASYVFDANGLKLSYRSRNTRQNHGIRPDIIERLSQPKVDNLI